MLKIWGRTNSTNVQKVMWTVAELALPHERTDVGGQFGGLDTPAYGTMNPNRLIPVIQDEGAVIWESNVIVRYLAAKYGAGSLWPEDPAARAAADQWMDWHLTKVMPDLHPVFWGLVRTPPEQRSMTVIETAAERLARTFNLLDDHLANSAYMADDHLTIGDIPLGAATYRYYTLPIRRPALPYVQAWYDRLQDREAFHRHVMIPLT